MRPISATNAQAIEIMAKKILPHPSIKSYLLESPVLGFAEVGDTKAVEIKLAHAKNKLDERLRANEQAKNCDAKTETRNDSSNSEVAVIYAPNHQVKKPIKYLWPGSHITITAIPGHNNFEGTLFLMKEEVPQIEAPPVREPFVCPPTLPPRTVYPEDIQ